MTRHFLARGALVLGVATAAAAVLPAAGASATVSKSSIAARAASGDSLAAGASFDGTGQPLAAHAGWGVPSDPAHANGFLTILSSIPGPTMGSSRTLAVSVDGRSVVQIPTGGYNLGLVPGGVHHVTVTFPGASTPSISQDVTVASGANVSAFIGLNAGGVPTLTPLVNNMTPTTPAIGYSRVTMTNLSQGTPVNIDNNGTPLNATPLLNGVPQTITLPAQTVNLTVVSTVTHATLYYLAARYLLAGINLNLVTGGSTLPSPNTVTFVTSAIPLNIGYRLYAADGGVFNFGDALYHGSAVGLLLHLNKPMVGGTPKVFGFGYWLGAADGGVFAFDANFYGSMGGQHLNAPVVGISDTADDGGYWLAAADGGIFSFGDAGFFGSMGGTRLNQPVTAVSGTASGNGYWLAAADGGIFAFGDARFFGSQGGTPLNKAVNGIVPTADGQGYWLVAADGGVFNFGDAGFYGSMGGGGATAPIVGIVPTSDSLGYWLVGADGNVYPFGDAAHWGSMYGTRLNAPVVFGSPVGNALPQA